MKWCSYCVKIIIIIIMKRSIELAHSRIQQIGIASTEQPQHAHSDISIDKGIEAEEEDEAQVDKVGEHEGVSLSAEIGHLVSGDLCTSSLLRRPSCSSWDSALERLIVLPLESDVLSHEHIVVGDGEQHRRNTGHDEIQYDGGALELKILDALEQVRWEQCGEKCHKEVEDGTIGVELHTVLVHLDHRVQEFAIFLADTVTGLASSCSF